MADERDPLETVKLSTDEVRKMTDVRELTEPQPRNGKVHDGRFGEKFDDEIHMPSVIWVTVGIAVVTALGFVGAWFAIHQIGGREAAAAAPPTPVEQQFHERRLPPGPQLQSSPERELEELRHEMHENLHGFGWVDEAGGVVRIPVEEAIDLVLENGLPAAETAPPPAPDEGGSAP